MRKRIRKGIAESVLFAFRYYRIVPGELTVVSGVPNSGKSEWLDALTVQLAELHGWRFSLASMEKQVPAPAQFSTTSRQRLFRLQIMLGS